MISQSPASSSQIPARWFHVLRAGIFLPLAIFFVFLVIYALTAQRGFSWQDSGEFQFRVLAGDYRWYSGIARAHPLYIALTSAIAACFPPSLRVYAITLSSGIGMASALAFLFVLIRRLAGENHSSFFAGLLAVVALGFSQMCWWMSSMAEVYTWSLAFLMAELYCLARFLESGKVSGWLFLLFFANGLHASVHDFALLELPVYLVCMVWLLFFHSDGSGRPISRRFAVAAACLLAWCAGAGFLMYLFFSEWCASGSLWETGKSLLFGHEYESVVMGTRQVRWHLAFANLALAGVSFLNPVWLFSLARGKKQENTVSRPSRLFLVCLLALTLIHFIFWIRYFVPDQATFVLPTLGLLAVWTGLGMARLTFSFRYAVQLIILSVIFSILVPLVLAKALVLHDFGLMRSRKLPYREEFSYWLLPWKSHETSAERFVKQVGEKLKAGDVVLADNTAAGALLAARENGTLVRTWRLISFREEIGPQELEQILRSARRVFLVSPKPGYTVCDSVLLSGRYSFRREGVLYRVLPVEKKNERRTGQ